MVTSLLVVRWIWVLITPLTWNRMYLAGLVDCPLQRTRTVGVEVGDVDDVAAAPPVEGAETPAPGTPPVLWRCCRRADRNHDACHSGSAAAVVDGHGEVVP